MSRIAKPFVLGATLALGVAALTACGSTATPAAPPTTAASTATPIDTEPVSATPATKPATQPASKRKVTSDVSQLKRLGIALEESVLIDVADDGRNRYLAVGKGGVVDFTGKGRTDDTMMSLMPARVAKKSMTNRVVIAPPFYNEDLGKGSCVTDRKNGVLRLATCDAGAANQVWEIVPAGDSGQFELHGVNTEITVDNGRIVTGGQGYVGLQTIPLAAE